MPSLGPQREAPFCSEGGRLVLLIAREGNGVMGAIFPTGRRWRLRIPWAYGALAGRPDGPRRATGNCDSVGREDDVGRGRHGAHGLPWGSELAEAFALGLLCPRRRWRHRIRTCLPSLRPRARPCVGNLPFPLLLQFRRRRASAGRLSVNLSTDLSSLYCELKDRESLRRAL